MTELTKEKLIEEAKLKIAIAKCYSNSGMARVEGELFKIALASLEAEPIGAFHIVEQQVDGTSYYIKDGEWPIDTGIIEVYAASPMTVVLNDVSGPLALAYKELTPAIMRNHIAVFERYGITPNDSITTIHALRIALDGIERSDAMLHGRQPCHQITASMAKAIALKLGAELNNEEAEIFADGYNTAMLHAENFRENKNSSTNNFRITSETSTNSPAIPDEVLSAILKVARVRADFDASEGDRRGIGGCLDEAEQELIVTINKYASQIAVEAIQGAHQ